MTHASGLLMPQVVLGISGFSSAAHRHGCTQTSSLLPRAARATAAASQELPDTSGVTSWHVQKQTHHYHHQQQQRQQQRQQWQQQQPVQHDDARHLVHQDESRHSHRQRPARLPQGAQQSQTPQHDGPPDQHSQLTSSEVQRQAEVLQTLTLWAQDILPDYMPPAERQWQPSALLPSMASPDGWQQLQQLQEEAKKLPTAVHVVLAGLAVHAAVVPAQLSSSWGHTPGLRDLSGADQHIWARWSRKCAGDLTRVRSVLGFYCSLCGCINSKALDASSHLTLSAPIHSTGSSSSGAIGSNHSNFDSSSSSRSGRVTSACVPDVEHGGESIACSPYRQLFGSLLQARMLRVMHHTLGSLADYHGGGVLSRILAAAAADCGRHELGLLAVCCQLTAVDPQGALLALAAVVQQGMKLPGCYMDDGWHTGETAATVPAGSSGGSSALYRDWMSVADCLGVWSVKDTAAAVQEVTTLLKVQQLLTQLPQHASAHAAAVWLMTYPARLRRLAEVQLEGKLRDRRRDRTRSAAFSWVYGREVQLL